LAGRTLDEVSAGFNQLWRRNIKKAEKSGVTVELGTSADLAEFHQLYLVTATRDHFTPRPVGLLHHDDGRPRRRGTRTGSGSIWPGTPANCWPPPSGSGWATHAWYSYGASADHKRELRPSNAIQWRMLSDAHTAGATVYDLRGITDTLDPNDHLFGLIQFKLGTGGQAVEYLGEWDYPLNPLFAQSLPALSGPARLMLRLEIDRTRFDAGLKKGGRGFSRPGAGGQGPTDTDWAWPDWRGKPRRWGADILAVGTAAEVGQLGGVPFRAGSWCSPRTCPGDPVVRRREPGAHRRRLRPALRDLVGRAVVVECRTSLRRHGVEAAELPAVRRSVGRRPTGGLRTAPADEPALRGEPGGRGSTSGWVGWPRPGCPPPTIWVSHLSAAEVSDLTQRHPASRFRARIGNPVVVGRSGCAGAPAPGCWTSSNSSAASAFGYRQRRARAAGQLLVVAGGTAHGHRVGRPTGGGGSGVQGQGGR